MARRPVRQAVEDHPDLDIVQEGKNLWSLLDTIKHQIPVPFTLTELMALYFGRDMLKVFKDTAFYDSLESLFQKVKTTLPPESIKYLKNVEQTLHLGVKSYKDYGKFKEILNQVNDAAINRKSIEIVYYTMSMKALTTAFLKWQEEQLQLEALGKQSTWQMYRRKLKVLNRNKLIVFVDQHFGIFPSHEVFMLANVPVHDIAKELNITRDQVYAKYTKQPLAENS